MPMDDDATRPAALSAAQACGWYGKLPALGDFSSRRLPAAMVDQCDAWLSAGLAASQQALGPQWLDTYLTAPVWRFAWAPGVAGPTWWLGVLMPSVDRVGRYFPLLLTAPCTTRHLDTADITAVLAWLDHLAAIAQGCLQPGARLDDLEAALAAHPLPWPGDAGTVSSTPTPGKPLGSAQRHVIQPGTPPTEVLARAARAHWLASLTSHSLWWSGSGAEWESSLTWAPGLPAAGEFARLLDGGW